MSVTVLPNYPASVRVMWYQSDASHLDIQAFGPNSPRLLDVQPPYAGEMWLGQCFPSQSVSNDDMLETCSLVVKTRVWLTFLQSLEQMLWQ